MFRLIFQEYRDAFAGLSRTIWLIGFVAFINRAGTMVVPFLTLYLIKSNGFTEAQAAACLLMFGVGSFVGSYVGGRLVTRFGSISILMWSLICSGLIFFLFPLLSGYVEVMVAVFLTGFCADAFRPAVMAATSENAPMEMQTKAFAFLRLAIHVGLAVGPSVGGILASIDYVYIFIGEGATCLLAGIATPFLLGNVRHQEKKQIAADKETGSDVKAEPLKDIPFMALMLLFFLFWVVIFQYIGVYPLYLNKVYGLPEHSIGLLFTINALILVAFEMILVNRLEGRNPLHLFGKGALIACVGFALLPFGSSFAFAVLGMVLFSIGEMISLPFSNTIVAQRSKGAAGAYLGVFSAVISLGIVVGPPAGIWVYDHWGHHTVWHLHGPIGFLILVASVLLSRWFYKGRNFNGELINQSVTESEPKTV